MEHLTTHPGAIMSDKTVVIKPRAWLELHNPVFEPDQLIYIEGEVDAGVRIGNGIDPWTNLKIEASASDMPTAHAMTHGADGSDPITPASIGAADPDMVTATVQSAIATSEEKLSQADTALSANLAEMDEKLQEHITDPNPHPGYSLVGHKHTLDDLPAEAVGSSNYGTEVTLAGNTSTVLTLPDWCTDPKELSAGVMVVVNGAYHNATLYGGYSFAVSEGKVSLTVYNDDAVEHTFLVNVKK